MYIILALVIGYILGLGHFYYIRRRVQCVNCGGYKTSLVAEGFGGEGGSYEYAVRHMEQYECKSCGEVTYIKMKLVK